ncbi:ATP-binding protein [Paraburkholderia sp. BR14427]|uniref:ATP-binding protein n=1 Tax=Paraburkholderia sp. BR14427 TaxID=3237008 RepID=UPI0034CEACF7
MKPEPSFDDWRLDNAQWLRLALRLLRARLHRHARRCACDAGRAADWLLAADDAEFDARAAIEPDCALAALEAELAAYTAHMREHGARAPALPMLADLASLDTLESDLLLMAAAPALDGAFELAYAGVHGDAHLTCATLHLALALHVDEPDARLIAADCLMPNRPLRALRLLEVDDREGPLLTRRLTVDERVSDFLRGVNHLDARLCPLLAPLPATPESVAARAAGEQAARAVLADADRWATLNLIGQLERGAADAAAAACAALGLRPLLLDLERYASLSAAERTGAILFFDEADALFGSRTDVRDSHDRYANLEINYLLQRMEDYAGLAILATNRRSALDPAFLRRLRFVIDFPFPNADERRHIWQRVFPPQAPVDGLELAFLSRLDLSGGNIRSIALNAAFLAASAGHPIDMPSIMRAAAREYAKLSKPAGGAEFGVWLDAAQGGARR